MNKAEFLSVLRSRLSGWPKEDIERSMEYYGEIIDDRVEEGFTEEEAIQAIGSIEEIILQISTETPIPKLVKVKVKSKRALKTWEIILLILGAPVWLPLIAAAVIIVFVIYIMVWAIILALYSVAVSFAACAIADILGAFAFLPSGSITQGVLFFGAGLICAGMAILLFLGVNQITKGVLVLSKKIWFGIKVCFVGKENEK